MLKSPILHVTELLSIRKEEAQLLVEFVSCGGRQFVAIPNPARKKSRLMQKSFSTSGRRRALRRAAFLVALTASVVSAPFASAQTKDEPETEVRKPRTVVIEIQKRSSTNPGSPDTVAGSQPTTTAGAGSTGTDESVSTASGEQSPLDIGPSSSLAAMPDEGQPPCPAGSHAGQDASGTVELDSETEPAVDLAMDDEEVGSASVHTTSAPGREPPRLRSDHPEKIVLKGSSKSDIKAAEKDANKDANKAAEKTTEKSSRLKGADNKPRAASELSIEEQQAEDEGECPGGNSASKDTKSTSEDIPLEQDSHPFDAPSADSEKAIEPAPVTRRSHSSDAEVQRLQRRIDVCLAYYMTHPENLAKRSPWAVMHAILPYGVEGEIVAGNRKVNSIGWMCYNGVCKTQRMFQPTKTGFRTNVGAGVQGHEGQFLAVLAQSGVPKDFPIVVGQNRYKVNDLVRYEMSNCRENSELTFQLIGLAHYLPANQTWRDSRGQVWNVEKMVGEELEQPIVGAACGGTHRLMGLSYAVMQRQAQGQPLTGQFARADVYLNEFVEYAWTLQNPDGSFSTDWFEGRANEPNMERKVQTTGHILEWLMFRLPDSELDDPRIRKAAEFLIGQIYDHRDHEWPIGPRGHSLRALALYQQRVGGSTKGHMKSYLAKVGALEMVR